MLRDYQTAPQTLVLGVLTVTIVLSGCVTPIDVKNASKSRLELLAALDNAVGDLQRSLNQWHDNKETLIQEEGRVLIARQAITVATAANQPNKQVTAQGLFDAYRKTIQPALDYALMAPDLDEKIKTLSEQIEKTADPIRKAALTNDLEDLRDLQAKLAKQPQEVKDIEAIVYSDLNKERETAEDVQKKLQILRAQIALMRAMAAKVDAWLAIDVAVSQDQVDTLKNAFVEAQKAQGGGGQ